MNTISRTIINSILIAGLLAAAVPAWGLWWTEDGIPICVETGAQYHHCVVEVEPGVIVVVWEDGRSGNYDLYAQKIHSSGYQYWALDGIPVCVEPEGQLGPVAVPDGAGGVIIAWWDNRTPDTDVYAQRLDADGYMLWTPEGVPVCTYTGMQINLVNHTGISLCKSNNY